jgi:transcriptional regulator with XRE-family HTH domain
MSAEEDFECGQYLPARIKFVRKYKSMSQTVFSKRIGVSQSYLSQVESYRGKPSIEMVLGIAKEFPDISVRWLLTGIPPVTSGQNDLGDPIAPVDAGALFTAMSELDRVTKKLQDGPDLLMRTQFLAMIYNAYASIYNDVKANGRDGEEKTEEFCRGWAELKARNISINFDIGFLKYGIPGFRPKGFEDDPER